jgi:hypothetical protein
LTGAQAKDFSSNLVEMSAATGATDAAFQKFIDANPGFAFDQLKATMAALAVEVGQKLLPSMIKMARRGIAIVEWVRDFNKEHPMLSTGIIKFGSAMGGAMLVGGPFILALPTIVASVKLLAGAGGFIKAAAGAQALGGAMGAANFAGALPLLGTIAGITTVGIYALIDSIFDYRDAMKTATEHTKWQNDSLDEMRSNLEKQGIEIEDNTWRMLDNKEKGDLMVKMRKEQIEAEKAATGMQRQNIEVTDHQSDEFVALAESSHAAANGLWSLFDAQAALNAQASLAPEAAVGGNFFPSDIGLEGQNPMAMGIRAPEQSAQQGAIVTVNIENIGAAGVDPEALSQILSEQIAQQLIAVGV